MRGPCAAIVLAAMLAAARAGEPTGAARVILSEGEPVEGKLLAIRDGKAVLAGQAPGRERVIVDLKQACLIELPGEVVPPDAAWEVVETHRGSVLYGRLIGLVAGGICFECDGGSRLTLPLADLALYAKPSAPDAVTDVDAGRHVVLALNGDVLVGAVAVADEDTLLVCSELIRARIPHRKVAAIHFPPKEPPAARPGAPAAQATVVAMRHGGVIVATDVSLQDGKLTACLPNDRRVVVPVGCVLAIEPNQAVTGQALSSFRSVLAWGRYADRDEEFAWTVSALKERLPGTWRIEEDFSSAFGAAFRGKLFRCRTLLIPEPEQWGGGAKADLAAQLKKMADLFLRRGGNIVVLGAQGDVLNFLREADLIDVAQSGGNSSATVRITPAGRRIARGVGESFQSVNATYFYRIGRRYKAESWAEFNGGSAVAARRVGRGWVILIGMDYYQRNDGVNQVLANAVLAR